jgi:ribosomal protein S18 acetylase RimI-like enzyme
MTEAATIPDPTTQKGRAMLDIRPYADADWEAICRVHDRARPLELSGSCDPRAFVPLAEDPTAEDIHRSRKWVACEGERVVGFVGVEGNYLSWLYVDPDYHGQSVGRRLLRLALSEIGAQAWTIALAGNVPARQLYASEGFVVTRTFEGENAGYPCTCVRLELRPSESREQIRRSAGD